MTKKKLIQRNNKTQIVLQSEFEFVSALKFYATALQLQNDFR